MIRPTRWMNPTLKGRPYLHKAQIYYDEIKLILNKGPRLFIGLLKATHTLNPPTIAEL